jgi:hypothetical protein
MGIIASGKAISAFVGSAGPASNEIRSDSWLLIDRSLNFRSLGRSAVSPASTTGVIESGQAIGDFASSAIPTFRAIRIYDRLMIDRFFNFRSFCQGAVSPAPTTGIVDCGRAVGDFASSAILTSRAICIQDRRLIVTLFNWRVGDRSALRAIPIVSESYDRWLNFVSRRLGRLISIIHYFSAIIGIS